MTETHEILDIRWRRSPFGDTLEPLDPLFTLYPSLGLRFEVSQTT